MEEREREVGSNARRRMVDSEAGRVLLIAGPRKSWLGWGRSHEKAKLAHWFCRSVSRAAAVGPSPRIEKYKNQLWTIRMDRVTRIMRIIQSPAR